MILWGILRPKPHLCYRTGSETAAVPKTCRLNMIFCKIHCLNTFDSIYVVYIHCNGFHFVLCWTSK